MRKLLNNIVVKYLTFSASTLIGTAVDFVVLWICAHGHFEGSYVGEYIISPAISFEFATVANFTVAYFFIWKDRISKRSTKSYIKHFLGYSPSMVTMGRFIFYLENRDNNTNFYLYNVSLPLMCLFGVETTERVKDFLYHFISESAKWIWTARKNALNIYSGKL